MVTTVDSVSERGTVREVLAGANNAALRELSDFVARWGCSSVSPFHAEPGLTMVDLCGRGVVGYAAIRKWAVLPADVVTIPGQQEEALAMLLDHLRQVGRRPVFTAVTSQQPYERAGCYTHRIADDPMIDPANFSLDGRRMSSVRHSVASARRSGLRVVPWTQALNAAITGVSEEWLRTKRGGEMGFTLGRLDHFDPATVDCRAAIDGNGHIVGFTTWRSYQNGHARVLDIMRRTVDAPNPTMDLLIADSLSTFAASGVRQVSLGSVPISHGPLGERVYPTVSLRRYKEKFAPTWQPLWLVAPSRVLFPAALRAVAHAFCPDGILSAVRRNP